MEKQNKRTQLINLLDRYIKKPKTKMKPVMVYYKNILLSGQNLKPKHFEQILPWIKHDLKMRENHLKSYFREVVGENHEPSSGNLDQFFI